MNKTGNRLSCETCGAEIIVIRSGDGAVTCHGTPMAPKDSAADVSKQAAQASNSE
jgi:hypothetical protein